MDRVDRLDLDANIFIRLFEGTDELADLLTRLLFAARPATRPPLVTSELTLAELLVAPYRNKNDRLVSVYDGWTVSGPQLEVARIDRGVLWHAAVLRAQHRTLKLPDAIHLSTAIGLQCTHMLTGDLKIDERYVLVPEKYGWTRGSVSLGVLRPEIDVAKRLIEIFEEK